MSVDDTNLVPIAPPASEVEVPGKPLAPRPGLSVPVDIRVRYGETDQMGVVYHADYIRYFEIGRTALMRRVGYPYARMEAEGLLFVVVEIDCKLRASARYDEHLRIATTVVRVRPSSVTFGYRIERVEHPEDHRQPNLATAAAALLTTGTTRLACLERATLKIKPIPPSFDACMRACLPATGPRGPRGTSPGTQAETGSTAHEEAS